jgi:hypothetical protein
MVSNALHNDLDLVQRGYRINPDWNLNFREQEDKVTKVIDGILDIELRDYIRKDNTMLSEVYFTKCWGVENYGLVYKIKEEYHKTEVLIGAILESTDNVLKWYDLTTKFNFNIIIVTPYKSYRFTYMDLLYEYVTMIGNNRFVSINVLINKHPRFQQMKEWVIRNPEYKRITKKTSLSSDPYSYMDKSREYREFLQLRDDDRQVSTQEYKGKGILPGEYNTIMGGQQFYQQIQEQQRELMRGQMSLRWSDYGTNNPCNEIEKPKVDKEWVSKLNKLLKKLKLK